MLLYRYSNRNSCPLLLSGSFSLLVTLSACSPIPFPEPPTSKDVASIKKHSSKARPAPGENWAIPPAELSKALASELRLRKMTAIGSGVTKPYEVNVYVPTHGEEIRFKFKAVPPGTADDLNNSPRKEIVADLIQEWFLDPDDYVVPMSFVRCVPIERMRTLEPKAQPNIPGTRCLLANAAVWMENVTFPEEGWIPSPFCTPIVYDKTRFLNDANYAYHLSNMNLLTYLIKHRDGRCGNFMISKDLSNQRVFSIDNGISFDNFWYRNYGAANWESIFVPAFRKEAIDRLRKLTREDLARLAVAVELQADEQGILKHVAPGPNMDPSKGARVASGRVQLGLTQSEIDGLEQRLKDLLYEIDQGHIALF